MDHADTIESEGHGPQNEIANDPLLRGNSTEHRSKSMAGGDDDAMGGYHDPAAAEDEGHGSMDVDVVEEGSENASFDGGLASAAAVAPQGTAAPLMSALASPTTGDGPGARAIQTPEQLAFSALDATHREVYIENSLKDGSKSGRVDGSAFGTEAIQTNEVSEAHLSPSLLDTLPQDVESSFDHAQGLSFDDEDSNDLLSEKASSMDAEQSEHDMPPPQDRSQDYQASERAPLERTYSPFIHPTDTSLEDARERLHVALEQTRLLRASFTGQAYERYRCVMKPVPESLDEILGPIQSDPIQARGILREQAQAIKVEKDMEKKQAQQAGVGLEELAYFGEGLHLVVLPEDEVDETEIDLTQFPHRGPIDPQSGERREDISAAAASTTEQVFDRIRRTRAFRMGADITPGAGFPDASTRTTHTPAQDQQDLGDLFSPGSAVAPLASSPAPSVDSDASSDVDQHTTKDILQHLLTLSPDAEGFRPDGSFTAVQSALIARGVGIDEMKRDVRVNPIRQRMVQPNYFSPAPSYKFLPPLLGPHQLYRMQTADSHKNGVEVIPGARESIKYVVEEICLAASKGKCLTEHHRDKEGSSGGIGGNEGLRRVLGEERGALEIDLLRRVHSVVLESQKNEADKRGHPKMPTEGTGVNIGSSPNESDSGDFDPLLAYSVMNAVGLVRKKEGNDMRKVDVSKESPEHAYAQTLGLESLLGLEAVSNFFHTNQLAGCGKKRPLPDADSHIDDAKRPKVLEVGNTENGDVMDDSVYQIRGGGGQDESKAVQEEPGETSNAKKNGVSNTKNQVDAPIADPPLAAYASFDPLYDAMSQVPLGDKQSQSVVAAAASRQLLQHQLGVSSDHYRAAALAQQLNVPIGSHLSSLPTPDLAEFYLRNGMAGNSDWSALQTTNSATRADILAQHSHLTNSLGLLHGQMNLTQPDQEAARAMLLREHHNAAAARAHGAVTAAAAHYQAALSSINPQNPFGFVTSSLSQLRSNETQPASSLPAFHETEKKKTINETEKKKTIHETEKKKTSSKKLQLKRSSSLNEKPPSSKNSNKETNGTDVKKPDQVGDLKRSASSSRSSPDLDVPSTSPNGSLGPIISPERIVSRGEASSEHSSAAHTPPTGLRQDIADLIRGAKFHEARSLSQKKSDESESLLIQFLLSLSSAVPIPKEFIADTLKKKLSSSNYQSRLHKFVGSSSSASASRDVIVAIISVWLWAEHKYSFKQLDNGDQDDDNLSYTWLINLAIDKSLSALATFFDCDPVGKNDGLNKETSNELIAAIASQSLAKQVFVDTSADASFPILEDLLKLLDSLRTNALQAKTQERVLLAALTSRCGNMSEAFSNAYVSSIVRAGVALGHETVCEIGQDEECRASTMLPYDFFHDSVGVWEEPCRPTTGYHSTLRSDELKKQAHARSLIQKSMLRLQNRLGLKGGISDGGPYFPLSLSNTSAPSTPTALPSLVRTPSGPLNRRGSHDALVLPGNGPSESLFNPDHDVVPMHWNPNDVSNFPYGHHLPDESSSENKKRKLSPPEDGNPGGQAISLALQHRSTEELEWEDVANMFFHGGSTRNIDINYDFDSNDHLGKKKIIAPFVRDFNITTLKRRDVSEDESSSDEDISDDMVLQRHQDVLNEMKLKLDTVMETRKQPPQQQRVRKR